MREGCHGDDAGLLSTTKHIDSIHGEILERGREERGREGGGGGREGGREGGGREGGEGGRGEGGGEGEGREGERGREGGSEGRRVGLIRRLHSLQVIPCLQIVSRH